MIWKVLSGNIEWLQSRCSAIASLTVLVIGAGYVIAVAWQPLSEAVQTRFEQRSDAEQEWVAISYFLNPPPCWIKRSNQQSVSRDQKEIAGSGTSYAPNMRFSMLRRDPVFPRYYVQWRPGTSEIVFAEYQEVMPGFQDWEFVSLSAFDTDSWTLRTLASHRISQGYDNYGYGVHADISPDGQYIAFTSCDLQHHSPIEALADVISAHDSLDYLGHYYEIMVMGLNEPIVKRLTMNSYNDFFPMWSPDGKSVAYMSNVGVPRDIRHGYDQVRVARPTRELPGVGAVWVGDIGVKTGIRTDALVRDDDPAGYGGPWLARYPPRWSPNGTRVAFVLAEESESRLANGDDGIPQWLRDKVDQTWAVFTMQADGGDVRRISEVLSGISWSPDGERLALVRVVGDGVALVTLAGDGSDLKVVTRLTDADIPSGKFGASRWAAPRIEPVSWSPDGSRILFRCGDRLCVVTLDGGRVEVGPLNLVDAEHQFQAAWSPDGSRIAVIGEFEAPPTLPDRRIFQSEYFRRDPRSDGWANRIVLFTMAPDGSDVRVLLGRHRDGRLDVADASGEDGAGDVRVCAAGRIVANPDSHPELVRDCETLLRMRDTLAQAVVLNWLGGRNLGTWRGVSVGGEPARVQALHLGSGGLRGKIPRAIVNLSELRQLGLAHNGLHGNIPAELGRLANLTTLSLQDNDLTGAIPAELGQLTNLTRLDLRDNRLVGAIPAELGQLTNLGELYLGGNLLTGCIPPALREVPKNDLGSLGLPNCKPG